MHTVVKGPSALATRRWQNMFLKTEVETKHVEFCPNSVRFAVGVLQEKWPNSVIMYAVYFGLARSLFTGQK